MLALLHYQITAWHFGRIVAVKVFFLESFLTVFNEGTNSNSN